MSTVRPIGFDEACAIVADSHCAPVGVEHVFLHDALNRVLACDIVAPFDMPDSPRAMMDGYLISIAALERAQPGDVCFTLAKEPIRAVQGHDDIRIEESHAYKIFTGARIPHQHDFMLFLKEHCREDNGVLRIDNAFVRMANVGQFIRKPGENYQKGTVLLRKGSLLKAAEIGLLASINKVFVPVFMKPRVAIICGGDEIVDLGEIPSGECFVRSINNHLLAMLVKEAGGVPLLYPLLKDNHEHIVRCFFEALQAADMVLFSGGMSVGDFDYVPHILYEHSDYLCFHRVRVKPGKPAALAFKDKKPMLGLGGFPNSTFVAFWFFVRPLLAQLCGTSFKPLIVNAILNEECSKNESRTEWRPCSLWLDDGQLFAGVDDRLKIHSAAINHLCGYSGFVRIDEDVTVLQKNAVVRALVLRAENIEIRTK